MGLAASGTGKLGAKRVIERDVAKISETDLVKCILDPEPSLMIYKERKQLVQTKVRHPQGKGSRK